MKKTQIRNTSEKEILDAITEINKKFDGNVVIDKIKSTNQKGTTFQVKLKVKDSRGKGARLGFSFNKDGTRRHLASACWHVFGSFYEILLKTNPGIAITSNGEKTTNLNEVWKDRNIGSQMEPLYYSEACDCGNNVDPIAYFHKK